jgi:hypothetical protein
MIQAKDIYLSKVCFNLKIYICKASSLLKAGSFLNNIKPIHFLSLGSLSFGEGWGEEKTKKPVSLETGFLMN